ncbi:MAG: mucoidy inhibitor MuiA family protein [Proteobacteria bacterium]|nr:mucoidy inhibitor MuiA family protein [Pseudomonadota bacterium]
MSSKGLIPSQGLIVQRLSLLRAATPSRLAIAAILAIAPLPALGAEFEAASRIDAVTVFPDGASVTRRFVVDLPAGEHTLIVNELPVAADPGSLRVAGAGEGRLTVGSVDARQPRVTERPDPERLRRLETLRDERLSLDDRISAERVRKRAAEALTAPGTLSAGERGLNVGEARLAMAAALEETLAADRAIREAERRQRALDREIAEVEAGLRAQPPRRLEARVAVEASAPFRGELTLTYSVRGARWSPAYDARLSTSGPKPALELVRRAEVTQQTGEDWSDVALTVSTVRVARGGSAPRLGSLIVRFDEPRGGVGGGAMLESRTEPSPRALAAPAPITAQDQALRRGRVQEAEAEVDMSGFQASFAIPGRSSVASGDGSRALRIGSSAIEPELVSRAVPSVDPTAYLEAQFRHAGDVPLMAGRIAVYRDGIFAGRHQLAAATRDDLVTVGFGPDDLVRIEHQILRRTDGSSGIISTSKTEEHTFRMAVRNGARSARRVVIEDRIPVSEVQDITVEPLSGMTPPTARDVRNRRGIVEWSFDLPAGGFNEIRHGWRLRWPSDRQIRPVQGRS